MFDIAHPVIRFFILQRISLFSLSGSILTECSYFNLFGHFMLQGTILSCTSYRSCKIVFFWELKIILKQDKLYFYPALLFLFFSINVFTVRLSWSFGAHRKFSFLNHTNQLHCEWQLSKLEPHLPAYAKSLWRYLLHCLKCVLKCFEWSIFCYGLWFRTFTNLRSVLSLSPQTPLVSHFCAPFVTCSGHLHIYGALSFSLL